MYKNQYRVKLLISICFSFLPLLGSAQEIDSLVFCEYPDEDAQPPFKRNELLHIILDDQPDDSPDCITTDGAFYYNIIILEDGSIALLNLECVSDSKSCFLSVDDTSKLEKWIPAVTNGENCNQKMRIKVYIHLQ